MRRIAAYDAAGVTEIGLVVPPLDLPTGPATLEALAPTLEPIRGFDVHRRVSVPDGAAGNPRTARNPRMEGR